MRGVDIAATTTPAVSRRFTPRVRADSMLLSTSRTSLEGHAARSLSSPMPAASHARLARAVVELR